MDFSIRTIQNYYKLVKSRRSFPSSPSVGKDSESILLKSDHEQTSHLAETKGLKSFKDHHLFKNILVSYDSSAQMIKRPTVPRLKTEELNYEPLSKRRDTKQLKTLCYKNQKTQRNLKDQQALQDLRRIGEISINNFDRNPEIQVQLNKDFGEASTQNSFQKWRSLPKQRVQNSKSPFKNRLTVGKRAKNSPKKTSMSLRIKRTFIKSSKNQNFLNLSTFESQGKFNGPPKNRKSSITPWQIEEETFY